MVIIATVLFLLLFLGATGAAIFWYYRKILREAKNFERGLKMVPLLIHLPPASDDIQLGGRDNRDVVDETISHAQVLYNIIASTSTKGFKSKFYGQRHLTLEIVATKGGIHYYCAVPIGLMDVVRQAIVAAYPTARLEEVAEHNIFSATGKLNGTIGGELLLKKNYAYPIATYQDTKRDAMQAILNALSTLTPEDGAAIQLLLRPADEAWSKNALATAGKKKKDKGAAKPGLGLSFKDVVQAPFKAPEAKESKPEDKQLSSLEQALVDSIEEKTRHPGYEVLIRVMASSNTAARAQSIMKNIVAAFALFDAPGRNGFKFSLAKDMEPFVTSFIFRFFPPEITENVLNSVELATVFHLPDQRNTPTSSLQRQASKQVDGPHNVPAHGLLLGYNVFRGVKKEIRLDILDRRRHVYIIGQTGTGKSNLLENLALQDMLDGKGFAFIDPHGDVAETLLNMVPKERVEDVVYFAPGEMDYPMGLNLFEYQTPEQKDFLVQEAINMLYKLYDPGHTGIMGPRYEHLFRNVALTIMSDPAGGTFIDIPKVFTDKEYSKQKLKHVTDESVLDFWNKEMAQTSDYHKSEVMGWFVSKFGAFLSNEMMRNIIGQTKSSFDLREIMDNKKILLVNLAKGKTGELNSKLLGMIFVMKFQVAAMSRVDIPEDQRVDFSLYVDEFQNFATDSFADILAEARKFRLSLVVANQFMTQLTEQIREAVIGNVGTVLALRVGTTDAELLVKKFTPVFDVQDLAHLPNFEAIAQVMISNVPTAPFSMTLIPRLGAPNAQLGQALRRLSAAKYGKPRAVVEQEIFKRLRTEAPPPPPTSSFGGRPGGFGSPPSAPPPPPRFGFDTPPPSAPGMPGMAGGSSFLDEWLSRRRQQPPVGSQQPMWQRFGPGGARGPSPSGASGGMVQPSTAFNNWQASAPSSRRPAVSSANLSGQNLGEELIIKRTNGETPVISEAKIREDLQSLSWMKKPSQSDFKVIDQNARKSPDVSDEDANQIAGMVQQTLTKKAEEQGVSAVDGDSAAASIENQQPENSPEDQGPQKVEEVSIDKEGRLLYSSEAQKQASKPAASAGQMPGSISQPGASGQDTSASLAQTANQIAASPEPIPPMPPSA